jgi:hypothetical protein
MLKRTGKESANFLTKGACWLTCGQWLLVCSMKNFPIISVLLAAAATCGTLTGK